MSDITSFEARISAALGRIRRGLDALPRPDATPQTAPGPAPDTAPLSDSAAAPPVSPDALAQLEARLAEERDANAQLEERVRALKDRQDTRLGTLEAELAGARDRIGALDGDLQALRETNAELRDLVAQLRAAAAADVVQPELINRAILAELDALRATRNADRTEIEEILSELRPIIEEAK